MFSSPVTGADIASELTSPTYTLTKTSFPNGNNGVAYIVTALGGTQANVSAHSVDLPFGAMFSWPTAFKQLPSALASLVGRASNVPTNKFTWTVKKAVKVNASGGYADMLIRTEVFVPVGAGTFDPENVAAALSLMGGCVSGDVDDVHNVICNGVTPS